MPAWDDQIQNLARRSLVWSVEVFFFQFWTYKSTVRSVLLLRESKVSSNEQIPDPPNSQLISTDFMRAV